jgi:hypothetical protein
MVFVNMYGPGKRTTGRVHCTRRQAVRHTFEIGERENVPAKPCGLMALLMEGISVDGARKRVRNGEGSKYMRIYLCVHYRGCANPYNCERVRFPQETNGTLA